MSARPPRRQLVPTDDLSDWLKEAGLRQPTPAPPTPASTPPAEPSTTTEKHHTKEKS